MSITIGSQVFACTETVVGPFTGSFTTPPVTVPLDFPTTFIGQYEFTTRTIFCTYPPNNSFGSVNVYSVTEFYQSPIFDIPLGFSISLIHGRIINNQFVTVIPEPSSLMLAAISLLTYQKVRPLT